MHILVFGIVQGVGYRKFTKNKAQELGITGSVRNLDDLSVEIFANGDFEILESFVSLLKIGPQHSMVDEIKTQIVEKRSFSSFEILRD